jgi:hypothetical protein
MVIMRGSSSKSVPESGSSPSFSVPGTMVTVTYEYSCALRGDSGYFRARLAGAGSFSHVVVSRTTSAHAQRSVPEAVPAPGDYRLVIESDCPWQVSVAIS